MYVQHVSNTHGQGALVVFDGYHGPSTKDETHRRRTGYDVSASVAVSAEMRLTMNKKAFLANGSNKQALIQLLAAEMVKEGISVEHAVGDADYKICKLACLSAAEKPMAIVAKDTVFQLLTHHVDISASNLYMITAKHSVCISTLEKILDPHLSKSILFLHAVSGCDNIQALRNWQSRRVTEVQSPRKLDLSLHVSIFFEGRHCKCRREHASGDVWMSDLTTPVSCSTGKVPGEGCYFCRICASREAPAHHRCCRFS